MAKSSALGFTAVGYHGKYKALDPKCHSKTVLLVTLLHHTLLALAAVPAVANNAHVEACI